ncbi:MAG TPA: acyl-CoA synthetase [Streptosporangiaceae bacterium]|jgi:acyl-CoA synthetase (AMP-forming)/AMP-acid ligase II|nr:acyl-CoA synthetase [Streptosporangiaceae bacterium]
MALNIADLFEHAVDAVPERLAIACGEAAVTYSGLEALSNQVAHYLAAGGVTAGDHVGVYGRNSIELVATFLACYKLRAIAVNVNYRYVEDELRYLFTEAELKGLVYDRQFGERVAAVLPEYPQLTAVLAIEDGSGIALPAGAEDFATAVAGQSAERDFGERTADDIYMLYTGGTTGYPKGVLWRHEDVWRTLGGGIDFATGERMPDEWEQSRRAAAGPAGLVRLATAPLIHGNAQWGAFAALFAGDAVVFVPQFDPHEIWRAVQRHRVNVLIIIGDAMARPLIEAYRLEEYDVSSVLAISSSAALFSPSVKEEYLALLPNVVVTDAIGASETGFTGLGYVSAGNKRAEGPTVTPGPSTIVIDEQNRPVGPGGTGRLARGGHIPLGYYKDPVKTAALFAEVDGARYAVPGDLARVEEDGSITLLGRGNTCVNTGGEKVYPEEVEGALKSFGGVFDALVIGVPDERLGQRVAAIVQPRDGQDIDLAALDAHLRTKIAGYKVPRSVWLVDQIGRTPAGKADYSWARRHAEEQLAAAAGQAAH